jgi:hypothetical protein
VSGDELNLYKHPTHTYNANKATGNQKYTHAVDVVVVEVTIGYSQ